MAPAPRFASLSAPARSSSSHWPTPDCSRAHDGLNVGEQRPADASRTTAATKGAASERADRLRAAAPSAIRGSC